MLYTWFYENRSTIWQITWTGILLLSAYFVLDFGQHGDGQRWSTFTFFYGYASLGVALWLIIDLLIFKSFDTTNEIYHNNTAVGLVVCGIFIFMGLLALASSGTSVVYLSPDNLPNQVETWRAP